MYPHEPYRPQFHFTARENWLNDPNGLLYYAGEYHLFFQHNPKGCNWGNMTWGHAVSPDLVHWTQLPHALEVDALGMMFSGSAVVDWDNTAGFQTGAESPLVAVYTACGSEATPPGLDAQCVAFSNDRGRTWTKYHGNPVVPQITRGNRDPKVFWHAPSQRWVMALYVAQPGAQVPCHTIEILTSTDLTTWARQSHTQGFYECPDLFELPVDGQPDDTRWVLFGADGRYRIGRFDGVRFSPETGLLVGDWGENFYAGQTFSDVPASDGRRILIAWMRGARFPDMPFNQQMTFPVVLTLRRFPEGIRVCRLPVAEIAGLRRRTHRFDDLIVEPGQNPLGGLTGDLLDIEAEFEVGTAAEFGFVLRGHRVTYLAGEQVLCSGNRCAPLAPAPGHADGPGPSRVHLRIVLDRASVEVFGNGGRVALSGCFLPAVENRELALFANGGTVRAAALRIHELRSSFDPATTEPPQPAREPAGQKGPK